MTTKHEIEIEGLPDGFNLTKIKILPESYNEKSPDKFYYEATATVEKIKLMNKHEIEIPDLPEGWRAVAHRIPVNGLEYTLSDTGRPFICMTIDYPCLIVKKIKPRRIVLEETDEVREVVLGEYFFSPANMKVMAWPYSNQSNEKYKIWRIVEEE